VLRYRGDIAAAWPDADEAPLDEPIQAFQGLVIALAIVEDEADTGGVFTLYLYADGTVADGWNESVEDALEALDESDELDGLPWAETETH
jgi:hypothetical protein